MDFGYKSLNGACPNLDELMHSDTLSIDVETSGTHIAADKLYGYSLSHNDQSAYFTLIHNGFFDSLVADESKVKLGHNLKFERSILKKCNVTIDNLCDTYIAAHLLQEEKLSLEALLIKYEHDLLDQRLWHYRPWTEYKKPIPYSTPQELANFFSPHAIGPLVLWNRFQRNLRAERLWDCFWNVEMPLVPVLSDIESNGAYIDTEELKSLGAYYDEKIAVLEDALCHFAYKGAGIKSINFNSADQIADLFYNKLKVPKPPPWTYRNKKRPSVDKRFLEPFVGKLPIVGLYLKYKAYRHLKDTYVTGILKRLVNGRIHTNFNQTRTRTGRLSSTDPNLQNIPMRSLEGKKIRRAFAATPEDGDRVILKVDFDQMELRDVACWADCGPLIDAFNNNEDVHLKTAVEVFGSPEYRPQAKTLHYQLVYGGGVEEHVQMFFDKYPEIRTWIERMHKQFEILGYVRTMCGRKRNLGNFERMGAEEIAHAKREGISTIVQGSCSEVMKLGMHKVWQEVRNSDILMILQVHDELEFDLPRKRVPDLVDILDRNLVYRELQVPLTISVSVGDNWGETVKYERYKENLRVA